MAMQQPGVRGLYIAFELGWEKWVLAFATELAGCSGLTNDFIEDNGVEGAFRVAWPWFWALEGSQSISRWLSADSPTGAPQQLTHFRNDPERLLPDRSKYSLGLSGATLAWPRNHFTAQRSTVSENGGNR